MTTIKFKDTDPRRGQVVTLDANAARALVLSGAAEEVDAKAARQGIVDQEVRAARLTQADPEEMIAQRRRNEEAEQAGRDATERSLQRQADQARERGEELASERERAQAARDPEKGTVVRTNDPSAKAPAAGGTKAAAKTPAK